MPWAPVVPVVPWAPVAPVVPWAPVVPVVPWAPVAPCKLKFDLYLILPLASATTTLVSVVPIGILENAKLPEIRTDPDNTVPPITVNSVAAELDIITLPVTVWLPINVFDPVVANIVEFRPSNNSAFDA